MSVIGQQMAVTVQAWLIFELTGSALQLGLLGLARAAPAVVLGLAGGIVADKVSQRKLLVVTIAIVGVIWTIFATLTYSGNIQVWQVLALVFAVGAVQSFQQASRQAIFPSLIDHRHMSSAVGLNSAIHPGARIFAPVVAGYLIDYLGVPMEGLVSRCTWWPWAASSTASWCSLPGHETSSGRRAQTDSRTSRTALSTSATTASSFSSLEQA